MAKKEGRGTSRNVFFKNQEMNFTVQRALLAVYHNGCTIGECLTVVQNTKNNDIERFVQEWIRLGDINAARAKASIKNNDLIRAKEYYLAASNYYKSATITVNPLEERHKDFWKKSQECFENAGKLFDVPMEFVPVSYSGKTLNCYFLPASKTQKSPVLFLVTGGEGSAIEMYFWIGAYALKNGYSIFLYEGPGNYATVHTSGLTMVANSEAPIGKALDALYTRDDVNFEALAMMGISFGGYLVSRAAAWDKRIKAIIPDSPLINIDKMLASVFPSFIFKSPEWLINIVKDHFMSYSDKAGLDLLLWGGGLKTFQEGIEFLKDFTIEGIEEKINCPTFALAGEGEGEEFYRQANTFINKINSDVKSLRVYTNKEGAGAHCQADNNQFMNQEVIAWLNEVFREKTI